MELFGPLLAGIVIGMILMAILAIGTYQRGYDEGYSLRRPWRAELGARRLAFINATIRRTTPGASSRVADSAPAEALPRAAAASG